MYVCMHAVTTGEVVPALRLTSKLHVQVCPEIDSLIQQLAAGKGEFFNYVKDASTHEACQFGTL